MFRLNNKGQSLVMFIVLIPIVILIMTLIFDIGGAIYEKNRLSNVNYMAVDYGLDNIDTINENDLIELIMKNVKDLNSISVLIDNDTINIKLSKNIKGIMGKLFGFKLINANSECEGILIDGEKRIERIK